MYETLVYQDAGPGRSDSPSGWVYELLDGGLGSAWVHLVGELDIATAPTLEQTPRGAQLRARLVMLDLRELAHDDLAA